MTFEHPTGNKPKTVIIVGSGPTRADYLDLLASSDPRSIDRDEVWGVNGAYNFAPNIDLVFMMDDYAQINGKNSVLQDIFETATVPVITSVARKECPTAVDYPLAGVMTMNPKRGDYLNHTCAYMMAYAALIGVEELIMFGCDYIDPGAQYANGNSYLRRMEPYRYMACTAYWAGICEARGMDIIITPNSPFLDADYLPEDRLYGYLIKPAIHQGQPPSEAVRSYVVDQKEKTDGGKEVHRQGWREEIRHNA